MKKTLKTWQIIGFVFSVLLGAFLHFTYNLSGQNTLVAAFSAINESTFEHMKILFFPMFVFSLVQKQFMKYNAKNFWCAKLSGTLLGLVLIPVLFYTYNGVFGKSPDFVNITIFVIAAAAAYFAEYKMMSSEKPVCKSPTLALSLIVLIAVLFVVFTYNPLQISLFVDPLTNTVGII